MAFISTGVRVLALIGTKVAATIGAAAPATQTGAAILGATTVAAGTAAAVKGTQLLTKALTPKLPDIPSLTPPKITTPTGTKAAEPSIEAARKATREDTLALIRRKRAGTILTSPEGGLLEPANVVGKTLLGA